MAENGFRNLPPLEFSVKESFSTDLSYINVLSKACIQTDTNI